MKKQIGESLNIRNSYIDKIKDQTGWGLRISHPYLGIIIMEERTTIIDYLDRMIHRDN